MQFQLELPSATVPLLLAETMTVAELVAKIVDAARSQGMQIDEFVTNSRIIFRGLPLMAPDYAPPRACLLVEAGMHNGVPEAERVLRVQHVKINFCCRGAPFVAPERETLKQMLRLEVALRTSNHALRAMGALVDSGEGDWMDVVKDMIQLPVTRAYGYKGAVAEEMALDCMLNARHLFPDDPDFVEIPFYVKYNRARDGPLVVGQTAPQVEMVPLDDVTKRVPLYELGKVTVLFAGSITWPPFREAIPVLNALYQTYESDKVAVRMVYIEEAHAADEWPVGSKLYDYKQTKALAERVVVAARTKALGLETPILLDVPPANKFSELYCPWPARFYIVAPDGALIVKPKPVNGTYDTGIIWDELGRLTGK